MKNCSENRKTEISRVRKLNVTQQNNENKPNDLIYLFNIR